MVDSRKGKSKMNLSYSKGLALISVGVFFSTLSVSQASKKHPHIFGKLFIDGVETTDAIPRQPAEWKFKFFDHMTGEQITKFQSMHGKPMHLVVVKRDFSEFAHLHPTLIGETGVFSIVVNQASSDPDNIAGARVINTPGEYYIYPEVFPKRTSLTPVMEMSSLSVKAKGEDVVVHPLEVDMITQDGEFVKYLNWDGSAGSFGDPLQIRLKIESRQGCNGNIIKFSFRPFVWNGSSETYLPAAGIEKWLTMAGHLFFISEKGEFAEDKNMGHLHSAEDPTTSSLVFYQFDRNEMLDGKYKMWLEFKLGARLVTAPMVIQYSMPARTSSDCKQ